MRSNMESKTTAHGHPRFYVLVEAMAALHSRKNHDYAGTKDPLSNLKRSHRINIPSWKGCLVRMQDKFDRIENFAKQEKLEVKDETVVDTLMDLAVYSLLCIILYEEDRQPRVGEVRMVRDIAQELAKG